MDLLIFILPFVKIFKKYFKIATDNIEDSFKNSAELELFPGSNVILKVQ